MTRNDARNEGRRLRTAWPAGTCRGASFAVRVERPGPRRPGRKILILMRNNRFSSGGCNRTVRERAACNVTCCRLYSRIQRNLALCVHDILDNAVYRRYNAHRMTVCETASQDDLHYHSWCKHQVRDYGICIKSFQQPTTNSAMAARRVALLVGTSEFGSEPGRGNLRFPRADVEALALKTEKLADLIRSKELSTVLPSKL